MLKAPSPKQHALEMVTLEELVPADHLLRKINRFILSQHRSQVSAPIRRNHSRSAV